MEKEDYVDIWEYQVYAHRVWYFVISLSHNDCLKVTHVARQLLAWDSLLIIKYFPITLYYYLHTQ